MLNTPAALELALRCPIFFSSGGEDDKPEMAESTLVRGDAVSAMTDDSLGWLMDVRVEADGSHGFKAGRFLIYTSRRFDG